MNGTKKEQTNRWQCRVMCKGRQMSCKICKKLHTIEHLIKSLVSTYVNKAEYERISPNIHDISSHLEMYIGRARPVCFWI